MFQSIRFSLQDTALWTVLIYQRVSSSKGTSKHTSTGASGSACSRIKLYRRYWWELCQRVALPSACVQSVSHDMHLCMVEYEKFVNIIEKVKGRERSSLSLAELAAESKWHSLAIEAAAAAQALGRVDLRFPVVFESEFMNASGESGLDVEELLSVARRESAMAAE